MNPEFSINTYSQDVAKFHSEMYWKSQWLPKANYNVVCPVCEDERLLRSMIMHLNDSHRWTREQIADWLDTLDLDLRF